MSSTSLKNANKLVADRNEILNTLLDEHNLFVLHLLFLRGPMTSQDIAKELNLTPLNASNILVDIEKTELVIKSNNLFRLSRLAEKKIAYSSISLDFLIGTTVTGDSTTDQHALSNAYKIKERIGRGATSITFRAEQARIHRNRTLKIFIPGTITYDQLSVALEKRALITSAAIPEIIEAGQICLLFPEGTSVIAPCVVLEYIDAKAKTFADFLESHENLSPALFERFLEQVGGALAAIEEVGLTHGDLHDGNILVTPGVTSGMAQDFKVIDFIGIPSTLSPELDTLSDLENFRDHLLRAAIVATDRYPGVSARLLIGERVFRVLQHLREAKYATFKEILRDFQRPYIGIPENHFRAPAPEPFEWLRVEWIPSQDWLYKLFEPDVTRYETIHRFGNTWISGPRGCGKSHYLRVLAFHPHVIVQANLDAELNKKLAQLGYNFKKAFGVLFACRLGEFKGFTPEAMGQQYFDHVTQKFLKHILVLKIWNKTLHTIREGLETEDNVTGNHILNIPNNLHELIEFLKDRLGDMAFVADTDNMNIFVQCLAVCASQETSAIAVWYDPQRRSDTQLLGENDLDKFFAVLKRTFPDLGMTQFNILVDDASFGNIHFEMQKVLNSLVRSVQANHCFKITCDKFMYTLDTSDGRSIDPRNEVTYVDLGEVSTKSQRDTTVDLSQYMAKVINLRLKSKGYVADIQNILGQSQNVREFFSALSLPGARRPKKDEKQRARTPRPKAYYAGWKIVSSITHGSIRTLLELVEYIFKENNVTQGTLNISLKDQDAAVRSFANRHFKALSMLPGVIDEEPIGKCLQAVISAIGEMSRQYLEHYDTGEKDRWYETLSLERLDRGKLNHRSQLILEELIKYGLLLDEGITFSRAQFGLCERYDLNKIFTPAFDITYRVRNHIYLSHERFDELLLKPDVFVRRHRAKLTELTRKRMVPRQRTLFEGDDNK